MDLPIAAAATAPGAAQHIIRTFHSWHRLGPDLPKVTPSHSCQGNYWIHPLYLLIKARVRGGRPMLHHLQHYLLGFDRGPSPENCPDSPGPRHISYFSNWDNTSPVLVLVIGSPNVTSKSRPFLPWHFPCSAPPSPSFIIQTRCLLSRIGRSSAYAQTLALDDTVKWHLGGLVIGDTEHGSRIKSIQPSEYSFPHACRLPRRRPSFARSHSRTLP